MLISPALAQYGHVLGSGTTTSVIPFLGAVMGAIIAPIIALAIIAMIFRRRRRGWLKEKFVALPIIVRTYKGSEAKAITSFQADSVTMAARGYFPTSQSWVPGQWGCGAFLVALLLCLILIGVLIFVYMLVVKPDGTLTVVYERRVPPDHSSQLPVAR
jgi:hypothetical protein